MQALIQIIVGLVAAIAATALAQFGVDLNVPRAADREVRRVADCPEPVADLSAGPPARNC
ncbi:MAG: hypothetical protein ACK4FB_02670 [Brevundimonas sp.]|uniref:hypothetical protein n=1 Tax=Brevundimonas sp. TaxID=1871086 RepID=UPI00391DF08F